MRVGLFIPCYVDAFFPAVGIATLQLLERLGLEVVYPLDQTCCGQMMANSGAQKDAAGAEALFVKNFHAFEYIVSADMSCLMHQKGCAERLGLDIRFIHIVQILNGDRA